MDFGNSKMANGLESLGMRARTTAKGLESLGMRARTTENELESLGMRARASRPVFLSKTEANIFSHLCLCHLTF